MKPQATIEQSGAGDEACFKISKEENGVTETLDRRFDDYQQALDFILEQGWQLKREALTGSLHVDTRFLKP